MEPLKPRITKSTAVAAIKARFDSMEDLLRRFEVAKNQANVWDGERDGLREAVKTLDGGMYGDVMLSWTTTAPVLYPNSSGKFHLEECLQTTIPLSADHEAGNPVSAIEFAGTPEQFLDHILSLNAKGKDIALSYMKAAWLGSGVTVANALLYEKKGSEKSTITVLT